MYIETIPITMNAKVEPATEPMITGVMVFMLLNATFNNISAIS
jgi:hypothetical protein